MGTTPWFRIADVNDPFVVDPVHAPLEFSIVDADSVEIESSLAQMVLGGVFDRFPKLKIVSAENQVGWVPYFMQSTDHFYTRMAALHGHPLAPIRAEQTVAHLQVRLLVGQKVRVQPLLFADSKQLLIASFTGGNRLAERRQFALHHFKE